MVPEHERDRAHQTGASSVVIAALLSMACGSESDVPPAEVAEASPSTSPKSEPAPATPPKPVEPPTPVAAPEKTFAEIIAPLVGTDPPSAQDIKTGWTHYKAKNYADAQRMFARASLFEPDAWKPAFNLACASALAADETMTEAALREAVARDALVVAEKARKDADLAVYRDAEWFEATLLGQTPAAAAPSGVRHDGEAYFTMNVGKKSCGGAVRLAHGRFENSTDCGVGLDADPDGNVFLLIAGSQKSIQPISREGKAIALPPEVEHVWDYDAIGGGQFWVAANSHVGFYDASTWRLDSVEGTIDREYESAENVLVDAAGIVWVANDSEVYRHDGAGYERVSIPGVEKTSISDFITAPNGQAWLPRSGQAPLRLQDGNWTPIDFTVPGHTLAGAGPLGARSDGTLAMWLSKPALLAIRSPEGSVHTLELDGTSSVRVIAADSTGRLWVAGNLGLFVIGSDLRTIAGRYPTGSVPAFASDDEAIRDILIRGAGPELPKSNRPNGWVQGTLEHGGKPLATAKFQMCGDPIEGDLGSFGTPCEGEDPKYGATTREDGSFVLTSVEPGLYELAVQLPAPSYDWIIVEDIGCCIDMPREGELELGKIDVPAKR